MNGVLHAGVLHAEGALPTEQIPCAEHGSAGTIAAATNTTTGTRRIVLKLIMWDPFVGRPAHRRGAATRS
jgi:hypothetical protein